MSAISSALFPQKLKRQGKKKNEWIQRTSKSYLCRDVSGPVYLTEEARHKYGEFIKQVEGKILQIFYLSIIIGFTSETDSWTNIRVLSNMFLC